MADATLTTALQIALQALDKAGGTCLGVAMSGDSHPAPDEALMGVFETCRDASAQVRAALLTATPSSP